MESIILAQIDSQHWELNFWDKILDKAIEAKSKASLLSSTSIRKIDACYWKGQRPYKNKENSKFYKEEKAKPAGS